MEVKNYFNFQIKYKMKKIIGEDVLIQDILLGNLIFVKEQNLSK